MEIFKTKIFEPFELTFVQYLCKRDEMFTSHSSWASSCSSPDVLKVIPEAVKVDNTFSFRDMIGEVLLQIYIWYSHLIIIPQGMKRFLKLENRPMKHLMMKEVAKKWINHRVDIN